MRPFLASPILPVLGDDAQDRRLRLVTPLPLPILYSELLVQGAYLRARLLHGRKLRHGLYVAHVVHVRDAREAVAVDRDVVHAPLYDRVPLAQERDRRRVGLRERPSRRYLVPFGGLERVVCY